MTDYAGETTAITLHQGSVIDIKLPGLTGLRIDTTRRVIAIDGLSGGYDSEDSLFRPEFRVVDLRDGIYGDFHRLREPEECFDPSGCAHLEGCADAECGGCGQHLNRGGAYPHKHATIEDTADCGECMERAADLRMLSGA